MDFPTTHSIRAFQRNSGSREIPSSIGFILNEMGIPFIRSCDTKFISEYFLEKAVYSILDKSMFKLHLSVQVMMCKAFRTCSMAQIGSTSVLYMAVSWAKIQPSVDAGNAFKMSLSPMFKRGATPLGTFIWIVNPSFNFLFDRKSFMKFSILPLIPRSLGEGCVDLCLNRETWREPLPTNWS